MRHKQRAAGCGQLVYVPGPVLLWSEEKASSSSTAFNLYTCVYTEESQLQTQTLKNFVSGKPKENLRFACATLGIVHANWLGLVCPQHGSILESCLSDAKKLKCLFQTPTKKRSKLFYPPDYHSYLLTQVHTDLGVQASIEHAEQARFVSTVTSLLHA